MQRKLIRVAVIGPESSGKTTLCESLAEHYRTKWVPEFSREYIGGLGRKYSKDDILYCIKKQLDSELELEKVAARIIFSDTELIIAKVWLLDVFGECPLWVDQMIVEKRYDLYLLLRPDIPFVSDTVRENPLRRQYFFEWYKRELDERKFRYEIIEGDGQARLNIAITKIDSQFNI